MGQRYINNLFVVFDQSGKLVFTTIIKSKYITIPICCAYINTQKSLKSCVSVIGHGF